MKRLFDIAISTVALIALSPLLVLFSLAVFLEDRKQPFFLQRRYGQGGKVFWLIKFRTMRVMLPGEKRQISDLVIDGRTTTTGKFLRTTYLDELPQLINIIKGDMSLVGPRPIPHSMKVKGIPNWQVRSTIRPGLTGIAQVYCTKYTTLQNKFNFDALYIQNMSLWLDIKLIALTAWKIRRLVAFVLWTVVILLVTLLPIAEKDIPGTGALPHIDKIVHFVLFAVMVLVTIWFGTSFLGRFRWAIWLGIVWGVLLASSTEFIQSFLPLRNMSLLDFEADMIGVGYAVVMTIFVRKRLRQGKVSLK